VTENITIGWRPTCRCTAEAPIAGTVLDPFLGSGTTALVADRLGRNCIGIELSPDYAAMARRRLEADAPLFLDMAAE
jgi:tRNA G10  N-methylase Trm11